MSCIFIYFYYYFIKLKLDILFWTRSNSEDVNSTFYEEGKAHQKDEAIFSALDRAKNENHHSIVKRLKRLTIKSLEPTRMTCTIII